MQPKKCRDVHGRPQNEEWTFVFECDKSTFSEFLASWGLVKARIRLQLLSTMIGGCCLEPPPPISGDKLSLGLLKIGSYGVKTFAANRSSDVNTPTELPTPIQSLCVRSTATLQLRKGRALVR